LRVQSSKPAKYRHDDAADYGGDLKWDEALALNRLCMSLARSPEMSATLTAIQSAFVPEHADRVLVVLSDRRLRDGEDAVPPHPDASLPLTGNGQPLGRLYVIGARSAPRGALLKAMAEACGAALAIAIRFERELHVALTFQNAALVTKLPDSAAYAFDSFYEPGKTEALVGGDWFDAFPLADGRVIVSVGDVLGSGLAAAIAMVNLRQTIRGVAHVYPDPAIMLEAADRALFAQYPDRFATAFVAVLDPVTQHCTYANAGHPPPLVRLGDGTVVALPGNGAPLGLGFGLPLNVGVFDTALLPGSTILLYTDGLIESTRNVLEGEDRLEAALRELDPGKAHPAQSIHDAVLTDGAADDVAILVIDVRDGAAVRSWRFDPAWSDVAQRVRRELDAELQAADFDAERRVQVELVLSELLGNALRYAPGTIELILEHAPDGVVLHLLDRGPGYRVNPHLPADLYSEFGRGLFLIANTATRFVVEHQPGGGSHARVSLKRARSSEP
jgi:anti-sigma regulatory factor (Ser/Thr protein kinase)